MIQDEAIKCRYCNEFLDGRSLNPTNQASVPQTLRTPSNFFDRIPWVLGFLFLGPFVLPFIWKNRSYSLFKKKVITGIVIAMTFMLMWVVIIAVKVIANYYKQIAEMYMGVL
jgi:hypothetical protein